MEIFLLIWTKVFLQNTAFRYFLIYFFFYLKDIILEFSYENIYDYIKSGVKLK